MPTHRGPIVAARDGLTVIDCAECGWAHLDPLPTAADLDAYYQGHFWDETKAGWLERYEAQRDWIDATNGDYLAALQAHTDGTTLLDVGCGYGFLVNLAVSMGWWAAGIEPSFSAVEYAEQNMTGTFHFGSWDKLDYSPGEYSAISAMWLMEHLPDPLAFLRWCRAHLREGGALMLAVPNEFTEVQALAGSRAKVPGYWVHPTHLNYWSAAAFSNLLGRAGFRVVDRLGTAEMERLIVSGYDYTADEALGAKLHASVRKAELMCNRGHRLTVARFQGQHALGRDQIVIAKVDHDTP